MKNIKTIFIKTVSCFFILLFVYASVSKLLDFENFQVQIAQSPLLSAYADSISYGVIIIELVIAGLLSLNTSRIFGLFASFSMMIAFSVYIYLILYYSEFIPCSCGGILENMGWKTHLIFNIATCILAGLAIFMTKDSDIKSNAFKKVAFRLSFMVGTGILSAAVVIYLFYSSEYIIKKENNFTRRFLNHPIIQENVLDLGVDSYYFAGINGDSIYLGNTTSPFQILKLDQSLTATKQIMIIPEGHLRFKSLTYQIFGKKLYGFDGSIPIIYKGSIADSAIRLKTISFEDAFFSQLLVVDSLHFAIRTKEGQNTNNVLGLLTLSGGSKVKLNKNILLSETQNNFDTDGKILFDPHINELYYIYFYRNQIMKINHNLDLTGTMKTIDTTSVSKVETVKLKDGTIKISKPTHVINQSTTLYKGLIFNRSGLKGKYERNESWKSSSIIDVYKINHSQYWGSFYVQHRGGKSLSHMLVTDQYLFALVGNDLIRYKLRKPLTDGMNGDKPKNHKTE